MTFITRIPPSLLQLRRVFIFLIFFRPLDLSSFLQPRHHRHSQLSQDLVLVPAKNNHPFKAAGYRARRKCGHEGSG
eukprot:COSAG01_NODE_8777_length_2662_cov_34.881779_2_plen_76_part_00